MLLREIKTGTTFTVTLHDERKLEVEYLGDKDPASFEINSSDISNDIDMLKGTPISVKFFSKALICNFTAKIDQAKPKFKNISPVVCTISSPIKTMPRRNSDRINIKTKAKLYSYDDGHMGKLLYEGKTSDISKTGIRLFFHSKVDLQPGTTYILEFTPHSATFILPAKLMQKQKTGPVHGKDYDYGFMFDTDNQAEYGERLIVDILKAQLESDK